MSDEKELPKIYDDLFEQPQSGLPGGILFICVLIGLIGTMCVILYRVHFTEPNRSAGRCRNLCIDEITVDRTVDRCLACWKKTHEKWIKSEEKP